MATRSTPEARDEASTPAVDLDHLHLQIAEEGRAAVDASNEAPAGEATN